MIHKVLSTNTTIYPLCHSMSEMTNSVELKSMILKTFTDECNQVSQKSNTNNSYDM